MFDAEFMEKHETVGVHALKCDTVRVDGLAAYAMEAGQLCIATISSRSLTSRCDPYGNIPRPPEN